MSDWLANLARMDGWQPFETAPKDGTPIIVDDGGLLYVVAWEERQELLGYTISGANMPPTWVGFAILTEFNPAMKDGEAMPDRFFGIMGIDDHFVWMPLPERKAR